jgi:hypothetical protein
VELLFPVEKAASYSQEAKEKEDVQVVMGLDPLNLQLGTRATWIADSMATAQKIETVFIKSIANERKVSRLEHYASASLSAKL